MTEDAGWAISRCVAAAALPLILSGCDRMTEVDDPFYLGHLEDPHETYLFRCIDDGKSCAVDGLPGPGVVAAGADKHYVVVRLANNTYIWFKRIPQQKYGWGDNPEKLIGPIDATGFQRDQRVLGLPEPTVTP